MELIKRGLMHPILRNNGFIFMATMVVALAGYLLNTTAARRFAPGQYSQFGIMINLLGALAPLSSAIIGAVLRRASRRMRSSAHSSGTSPSPSSSGSRRSPSRASRSAISSA